MYNFSREKLLSEAAITGFRLEVLEKVHYLLDLLEAINSNEFLRDRLALKGGTALNLFIFELPRLSVDIDLNYIGSPDRKIMEEERKEIEKILPALSLRLGLIVQTPKKEYALTSWALRYQSVMGGNDNVKVEINFIQRVPIWPPVRQTPCLVGTRQATDVLVLDEHELDFERNLIPLLRQVTLDALGENRSVWGHRLAAECREALAVVLPLTEKELHFLNRLND